MTDNTRTERHPPSSASALDHQGVLYDDPSGLVDAITPQVLSALADRHTVAAIVDDETAERLRNRIGPEADGIVFTHPAQAFADPAQTMVARRRREAAASCEQGPMTVIGQFQPWMEAHDVAFWESMFNLVLAELPVTLLCACPVDAGDVADVIAATHPRLCTSAGAARNAAFRDPLTVLSERPPLAPPPLGVPTGEKDFASARDLAVLRKAVAAHAQVVGLPPDRVDDTVYAVSEITTNCVEHGAGHGNLLMWAAGGELIWEVHDPGRSGSTVGFHPTPTRLGLTPPSRSDDRGRGIWIARELCDRLHVWSAGDGTSVRGTVKT